PGPGGVRGRRPHDRRGQHSPRDDDARPRQGDRIQESWSNPMTARCYEDFTVGLVIRHSIGRTVTATDNAWFTLLTNNSNPIHFDRHYAAQTEFGQPLVNSTFTL